MLILHFQDYFTIWKCVYRSEMFFLYKYIKEVIKNPQYVISKNKNK